MRTYDIGYLGGGQLARMSVMAAQRSGLVCLSLDPGDQTPASQVADSWQGDWRDPQALAKVFDACERVTLENEFVPARALEEALRLSGRDEQALLPGTATLATIQDKLAQRLALERAGVPSPQSIAVGPDLGEAADRFGLPFVVKTRYGGYDGKGTLTVRHEEELPAAAARLEREGWHGGLGCLAEEFVPFERELAVMVFRQGGRTGSFPPMVTVQTDHVCDLVFPMGGDPGEAIRVAEAAVEAVDGHGLFGVELFEDSAGRVSVNEMAPRPHNTGHYTLDWGGVSQFEQHVRLVCGLPTVTPDGAPTCMANLLGQPGAGDWRQGLRAAVEAVPDARVHWYGKAESRPGRKMGHINVVGPDCRTRAVLARERFYAAWTA
jgi:5-(carboxyamino)imidazole ribonucleotide synthase